ncbi:MAG: glycosyltransferase [Alphaproteobacteria bacterium]|nr:glycosyltransferase [Alphaproteobacteria bacterium]
MPLVSVIIPVYNVEQHLRKCLDSVLEQTFRDMEVICVNDGSTDGSAAILEEYAAKDKRFKIITQKNQGLSAARNNGLAVATAKHIAYVDSDDFVHPRFLEILYSAATENDADVAGCNFCKIFNDAQLPNLSETQPREYKPALNVLMNRRNFIHFNVWNKLYKQELISDIPFVDGIYFEDWVYNCCVFAKARNFVWINEKLYGYRISDNSIMRSSFTGKKLADYVEGIHCVRKFYKEKYPQLWPLVRDTRIARTVKMMMNSARRSHNSKLIADAKIALKKLYNLKLIGYRGLSLPNKIKLFYFLH